jgi:putative flavoprotein involved in K+ transport
MAAPDISISVDTRAAEGPAAEVAVAAAKIHDVSAGQVLAQEWLDKFARALASRNESDIERLFLPGGYWRDILALHWDLRTFSGRSSIAKALAASLKRRGVSAIELEVDNVAAFERRKWGRTVEAVFDFETDIALCRGHLRLLAPADDSAAWSGWTLFTSLESLKGYEERAGAHRVRSTRGHDAPAAHAASTSVAPEPEVLVIGAGQAGLAVAARLKQLDLRTVIVDRERRVGDNWRNRYQSLLLHNQIWANHLPYLPFPASWPAYLSKNEMADWLETYAKVLGLDVWLETKLLDAAYDDDKRRWTVRLARPDGTITELHPRHVIQATGVFGVPNRPTIRGSESFEGRLIHAEDYEGGIAAPGTRVLVVGAGSSAHDVAQDLYKVGADVTMLQRSSTCVVSVEPGAARAYSIYAEDGPPVEDADFVTNSMPFPLLTEFHKELTKRIADMDHDLLQGLRKAGFALDFGEDESGFLMKYHRYGGGYYINAGCSELIVAGKIRVKQGVSIERLESRSVKFSDGTSMDVDVVVVAAGYSNMSESVRLVMGDEVADRVGPIWGLDQEGEVRGMWRPTGQRGFWLMGGSLQQCRPYSKYLALQIKADLVGLTSAKG